MPRHKVPLDACDYSGDWRGAENYKTESLSSRSSSPKSLTESSDFLRLPFQAIEVYLAHVNPSTSEMQTDITSEILFHANVSIRLLGQADDGVPMIQAAAIG